MALLFCDSVRHYTTTANARTKYNSSGGSTNTVVSGVDSTAGRGGGPALFLGASATNVGSLGGTFARSLPGNYSGIGVGFRYRKNGVWDSVAVAFFALMDEADAQLTLTNDTDGILRLYRGNMGTLLATDEVAGLAISTWMHVEIKAVISSTVGSCIVKINGQERINISNANTQATANAHVNRFAFGNTRGTSTSNTRLFCDVVAYDTDTAPNNDFMGEVNVDAYLPNGAGNYAQLTPSAGDNYACVDEDDPNTTDYVSSSTNGHIDTYAFADMGGNSPNIKAVVNNLWALKTDSGDVYAKSKVRRASTDYTGPNLTPPLTTYTALQHVYETDPATSAAWTKANVNAAEFGVEVSTA